MLNIWQLPMEAEIGGSVYPIHGDFRDILEIMGYLSDPDMPVYFRWRIAIALFYEGQIPRQYHQQAMEYLAEFILCGSRDSGGPAPRLLDWQQDAELIVADVNRVAGQEIRALPFVHWWTFLAWFHGIGEGQLATVTAIRSKLQRGKKLEPWEQEYYRQHKVVVELKQPETAQQRQEKERLEKLLQGGK